MTDGNGYRRALTRAIAVENGKGGVGKTTISTHLGASCAMAGMHTLLVDLDPQANTQDDLGYVGDGGLSLLTALGTGVPPTPIVDVRPGLDVIAGGPSLSAAAATLDGVAKSAPGDRRARERAGAERLARVIAPLAAHYDLVIFDCPPVNEELMIAALVASQFVLVPTKSDVSSIKGLAQVAGNFEYAREFNPQLELLGIVIFGITAGASVLEKETRDDIYEKIGEVAPIFQSTVRHVEKVAQQIRKKGRLAHELEAMQIDVNAVKGTAKSKKKPGSTTTLAGDLQALAEEVVPRFVVRVQEMEAAA